MSTGQKKMQQPGRRPQQAKTETQGVQAIVGEYPLASVLIAFGVGLGVGVALETILAEPVMARPTFGQRTELAAEKFGRQMLDAIAGVLPESVAKHITCQG